MRDIRLILKDAGFSEDQIATVRDAIPAPDSSKWNPDPTYLRELLEAAGLSQRDASSIMGITYRQMRHYCAGTRECPYGIQYALEMLARLNTPANLRKRVSEDSDD